MRFILISLCLITIASCSEEDTSVVNDWGPMPRINLDRDAAALPVIDTSQDSGTTPRDASMPQEVVDAKSISNFQSMLSEIARTRCNNGID